MEDKETACRILREIGKEIDIKILREATSCSKNNCRIALDLYNWDLEQAINWLPNVSKDIDNIRRGLIRRYNYLLNIK